jgi:hypothetical protein
MKLKKIIVAKIDDYKIYPECYSAMKEAGYLYTEREIEIINKQSFPGKENMVFKDRILHDFKSFQNFVYKNRKEKYE